MPAENTSNNSFTTQTNIIPLYYWTGHNNFGDELSPYIVSKLSGKNIIYAPKFSNNKLVATGSLIHRDLLTSKSIIWGTGCMSPVILNLRPFPLNRLIKTLYKQLMHGYNSTICAVRGPLTRNPLLKHGIPCPKIYGDPAIILPLIYTPKQTIETNQSSIGLILHHSQEKLLLQKNQIENSGIRIISVFRSGSDNIEKFIDEVTSCKYIFSSSLHGIIVAQTYGIDCQWITFQNNSIHEYQYFKFIDYFQGSNQTIQRPLIIRSSRPSDISVILKKESTRTIKLTNREKLIDAFPQNIF